MNDLEKLSNEIRKHIRENWDEVIAIEGQEGVGKTDLAIIIGMIIDPDFDFIKNIAYLPSLKDIGDKFDSIDRYSVLIIDETIKVLYKMRSMERLQIKLVEKYSTDRKQNKVTELAIPRFMDLNEQFRNHRVRIRIWIPVRGRAIVYVRDDDKDIKDPWHIKNSVLKKRKLLSKNIVERNIEEIIENERHTLNYLMDFTFDDLNPELWTKYFNAYSVEKAREKEEKDDELESTKLQLYRIALSSMIKEATQPGDSQKTQRQIAEITGLSQKTISVLSRTKADA